MSKLTGTEETALNNACARLRETHLGTHVKTLEEFVNQNTLDTESDTISEAINELYHMIVNNDCASIQIPPPGFFTIFGNDETGDLMVYYNDEDHPPVFHHVDDPTADDFGTLYLYIADPSGNNHYELKIGEYIAVTHLNDYYTKSEIDTAFSSIESDLDAKASVEYVDNQITSAVAGGEIDLSTYVKFSDVDTALSSSSTNPVQNKTLKTALDSKSDTNHTHSYLSLSGGTMTGNINLTESGGGNVPFSGSLNNISDIPAKLKAIKSFLGSIYDSEKWWNFLSIRHRNGSSDGSNYGMYIKTLMTAAGDLIWNKQTGANVWQGERTIIDSNNYKNYVDTALSSSSTNPVQNKVINDALMGKADRLTGFKTANLNLNSCSGTFYWKVVGEIMFWRVEQGSPGSSTAGTHTIAGNTGENRSVTVDIQYQTIPYHDTDGVGAISYKSSTGEIRLTHYRGTKGRINGSGIFYLDI